MGYPSELETLVTQLQKENAAIKLEKDSVTEQLHASKDGHAQLEGKVQTLEGQIEGLKEEVKQAQQEKEAAIQTAAAQEQPEEPVVHSLKGPVPKNKNGEEQ